MTKQELFRRIAAKDSRYAKFVHAEKSEKCVHLGDVTGAMVACTEGCKGTQLKVFSCAVHGDCTIAKKGEGVTAICESCKEKTYAA